MTTEERFTRIETILERLTDNQQKFEENQHKFDVVVCVLTEAQTRTEQQIQTLTATVDKLGQQTAALERQWQAYLTTICKR